MKNRTSKQTKHAAKTAPKSADAPIPYVPTPPTTLADLSLTPARAWALAMSTHDLAPEVYGLRKLRPRGRMLHEEFGFAVMLIVAGECDASDVGDVYAYVHEYDHQTDTYRERARSVGMIEAGRFVDAVEITMRSYAQTQEVA